jgi:hypothetical protein
MNDAAGLRCMSPVATSQHLALRLGAEHRHKRSVQRTADFDRPVGLWYLHLSDHVGSPKHQPCHT